MALVLSGILDTSGYFISSTIAYDIESFGSFLNGKKLKSTIVLSHIENTTEKISVLMAKRIRVRWAIYTLQLLTNCLIGKLLHAESKRFCEQEEIILHCSTKLAPWMEAVWMQNRNGANDLSSC